MNKNRAQLKKNNAKLKTTSSKNEKPANYETMSQQQNRHGKGRQQPGSDGGSTKAGGSNH